MFDKAKKGIGKDGDKVIDTQNLQFQKYQNDMRTKLIEWQIENKCLVSPRLVNTGNALQALFSFNKATNEQVEELKKIIKDKDDIQRHNK